MSTELITPATGAETISNISIFGNSLPATIIATGLGAAESIDINILAGAVYEPVYQDTLQITLTETNNVITIYGPGKYQIVKPVTVGSCGVYISSEAHR